MGESSKLATHLLHHLPKCIEGFRAEHLSTETGLELVLMTYALACKCGGRTGKVVGHPLAALNPSYDGPPMLVSPLLFECTACVKETAILDTDVHGYHGELGASAKLRGRGEGSAFSCPTCAGTESAPSVTFTYCGAVHDLLDEGEPKVENYFEGFLLRGKCAACETETIVSELDL